MTANLKPRQYYTLEEYFALEKVGDAQYEYWDDEFRSIRPARNLLDKTHILKNNSTKSPTRLSYYRPAVQTSLISRTIMPPRDRKSVV